MERFASAVLLALLAGAGGSAQTENAEEKVLTYAGSPLAVPAGCTTDDMASFGLVCPPDRPCPVYLELTSVGSSGGKLFLAGNLHSESVTMYSILLASADGGLTWTEPHERVPRAGLDRVVFFDEKHGWAAGHVLNGQPRDPFFLLTSDGGRFWRRRDVYDDTRHAVIEDFWFDSERSGVLLIDRLAGSGEARYERYETMTGAESWMIREVSSQPIRVRRRPVRNVEASWRIVPREETKAWLVQRRDPAGWVTVSEFQIEPGVCVEPREVLAEAEPEPDQPEDAEALAEGAAAEELPVAPGGVFVIGTPPPAANRPAEVKGDDEKRPTLKKPKP